MANRLSSFFKQTKISNSFIAFAGVLIVFMLLMPVSGAVLDFLMIVNIAISIIIFLVVLYTPKASRLSSFPRVVLFVTVFGLALNVCSTRYILTHGHRGFESFDGAMIKSFANVVAKGQPVIGFIIFLIIIIIQVVVITKGAGRVSEVQARFALDSMNSKMFAVDSELNSGSITDEQARQKKADIQRECDFYSAMDGSSKFVSGNVKAGIFITLINLVGGVLYAKIKQGMDFSSAIATFPQLTIGDGLLSQLPSLLISVATGILVTGGNSDEVLGEEIKKQFNISSSVYMISGGILAAMAIVFHTTPLLVVILIGMGALLIFFGYKMQRQEKLSFAKKLEEEAAKKAGAQSSQNSEELSPVVPLDPLCLELGVALLDLVNKEKGAELLERITRIRREAAIDLGLVVPRIRIIDNLTLDPQEYSFKIRGIEAGRGKLKIGYYMCLNTGSVVEEIKGEPTRDPTFGIPAIWIGEDRRLEAERNGYSVIDPPMIIATHMTEIIRSHAAEILGRQEVSAIITKIKETNPVVVEEVMDTYKYTYGEIEKILQGLLRERVSIRNIVSILETLANYGNMPHNPFFLIGKVREALGLQICLQYVDPNDEQKKLSVIQLSQEWAQKIIDHIVSQNDGSAPVVAFDPVDSRNFKNAVSSNIIPLRDRNILPIILAPTPDVRQLVYQLIERDFPGTVVVLSVDEVLAAGNSVNLEILGEISE
ncbi:flagellar biosynthesis protein FlhA [Treponema berlinense]|uniref:flagellar biosynthesis protein FlhA n=1 Tax=Treponema berlinense TaxID=225004 RepID=UPI0023529E90